MQAPILPSDSLSPEPPPQCVPPHKSAARAFNVDQCFVRFRALLDNGFVKFDFAIGDPSLNVELVMPKADYESFCALNHAIPLDLEEGAALDLEQLKWRFGQPGLSE